MASPSILKLLLANPRVDPAVLNNYAIRWASNNGCTNTVDLLINAPRVDPTADDNFAFIMARANDYPSIEAILISDPRVVAKALELNQTYLLPHHIIDMYIF